MTVQTSRLPLTLAGVGIILFIGALLHQVNGVPASWRESLGSSLGKIGGSHRYRAVLDESKPPICLLTMLSLFRPSFYNIALSHGSDKVTVHDYHSMSAKSAQ